MFVLLGAMLYNRTLFWLDGTETDFTHWEPGQEGYIRGVSALPTIIDLNTVLLKVYYLKNKYSFRKYGNPVLFFISIFKTR